MRVIHLGGGVVAVPPWRGCGSSAVRVIHLGGGVVAIDPHDLCIGGGVAVSRCDR